MTSGLPKLVGTSFATLLLVNCAHTPPNVEGCIRLNRGAACTHTVKQTNPDRTLTETEWQAIRLGRISVSPSDWAKIRFFIEKICARRGACDEKWKRSIDTLGEKVSGAH